MVSEQCLTNRMKDQIKTLQGSIQDLSPPEHMPLDSNVYQQLVFGKNEKAYSWIITITLYKALKIYYKCICMSVHELKYEHKMPHIFLKSLINCICAIWYIIWIWYVKIQCFFEKSTVQIFFSYKYIQYIHKSDLFVWMSKINLESSF